MTPKNESEQDNTLAAFTDALLAGQPQASSGLPSARPPLASVVEVLAQTANPHPPPKHLRQKIRRRIAAEWAGPGPLSMLERGLRRLPGLFRPARQRLAWAGALAAILALAAAALLLPEGAPQLTATAGGEFKTALVVCACVAIAALAAGWYIARKK